MSDAHTLLVVAGPEALSSEDIQTLEARGFAVVHAPNDDEGRGVAETQWPDVLLWSPTPSSPASTQLPAWLRSVDPAVGLILLAGEMSGRAVANAVRTGFDDCLIVPVGSRELTRTVDDVLRLVLTRRGRHTSVAETAPPAPPEDGDAMALPLERLCAAVADELHRLCSLLQERLARLAHAGPDAVLDAATLLSGVSAHLTLLEGRLRCLAAPPASESGPANVTVALREAIALVQPAGQPGETMVGLDLAPDLPRPALGDAALRQVLAELLHNAILATANSEEKHVRVSVRAEEGSVSIEVADTGIGILPADVERIFEPLVSSRRAPFGVGLGLYCCRRILGPVGATIVASGRPGRGATFTVRIPIAEVSSH